MKEKKGSWTVIALVSSLCCLGAGVFFGIGHDALATHAGCDESSQTAMQNMFPAGAHDTVVFQFSGRK
jgi:hypothetical protein